MIYLSGIVVWEIDIDTLSVIKLPHSLFVAEFFLYSSKYGTGYISIKQYKTIPEILKTQG